MYNFDKETNRKKTNSFKWKCLDSMYGNENLYPMWVADMEFEVAPAIQEQIEKRTAQKIYGYEMLSQAYYEAVAYWLRKRHSYEIKKEWVVYCPSVMTGLSVTLQALTDEGDEVLVSTPVYGHFFSTIKGCGRNVIEISLIEEGGSITFDISGMEKNITDRTKALLLCNPHNPIGRVWKKEELQKILRLCETHGLILISDEVHFDLVFDGEHTMAAVLNQNSKLKLVTLMSASKTFNVAGIQTANLIVENPKVRELITRKIKEMSYPFEHAFAEASVVGGYLESEQWLDELLVYLRGNRDIFLEYLASYIPILKPVCPEATYLIWVDCRKMGMEDDELKKFWIEKCNLALSDGREFGQAGRQYVRFNIACQRENMIKVLKNIKEVFQNTGYIK